MAPSVETRKAGTQPYTHPAMLNNQDEIRKDKLIDVLIVGAGPAGLMLAACATQAGLTVRIVDSGHPSHHEKGRGDALQCRTIEVLRSVGVGQQLVDQGVKMFARTFWDTSNPKPMCISRSSFFSPTFDIDDCYSLGVRQGLVEDALRQKLFQIDATQVDYGWSFVNAELHKEGKEVQSVNVRLQSEYGKEKTICARYMVGCDGGKSAVRKWLRNHHGIVLEGDSHDSRWAAVDIVGVETDFPDIRNLSILHGTSSTVLVIPREPIQGNSCVRLYCQLPDLPSSTGDSGQSQTSSASNVTTLQEVLHIVHDTFSPFEISFQDIHWFTVYTVGQRLVSALDVQGRIFLAGDAAHLHSPKGGLGMNTSLMDAHNLAFKLALVEKHGMHASLLNTYNLERRMVAEQLINMDRDLIQFFASHHQQRSNKNNNANVAEGKSEQENALAVFQRRNEAYQSGVSILYPPSQLVGFDQSGASAVMQTGQPAESRLAWLLSSASQPAVQGGVSGPFGLFAGARLLPALVTRWKDCNPISLLDSLVFGDARFSVFVCTGLLPTSEINAFLKHVAKPGGLYQRLRSKHVAITRKPKELHLFPGLLDPKRPLLQLIGITMHHHLSMELAQAQTDLCCYSTKEAINGNVVQFNPDWWLCDDQVALSPYENQKEQARVFTHPAHEKWRIDPNKGALVVVRPDGHVALVTSSIYEWDAVEKFFTSLLPDLA